MQLGTCNAQEVTNATWALARLSVGKRVPMTYIASLFVDGPDGFNAQNTANLAWAFATFSACEVGSLAPFWSAVVHAATRRISEFQPQELANMVWSFATIEQLEPMKFLGYAFGKKVTATQFQNVDVSSMLAVVWGFSFTSVQHSALYQLVHRQLVVYGQSADAQSATHHGICALGSAGGPTINGEPRIALEVQDVVVINKPPGWEVERGHPAGNNSMNDQELESKPLSQIRSFLASAARPPPIWLDKSHHFGFLHRLDVPGSGLVLAAKSYESYYDLLAQLNGDRIARHYLVLCHGWVPQNLRTVAEPIRWTPGDPSPSQVACGGKPSLTSMEVVARLRRSSESFTMLAVRIHTGRTHQIRAA